MNTKSLLVAALAGVALSVNAFAYSPTDSSVAKPRPIPATVVNPTGLPRSYMGSIIKVEFTLDQAGQPHDIKVLRVSDPIVTRQLVAAVSQWRFESKGGDAGSSAQRFILPIELRPGV
jgi:outer membrane biosynthesis protein TonB